MGEIILRCRAGQIHYSGDSRQAKKGKEIAIARLCKITFRFKQGLLEFVRSILVRILLMLFIVASMSRFVRSMDFPEGGHKRMQYVGPPPLHLTCLQEFP